MADCEVVGAADAEEWYEFYPEGLYDLGDGGDPVECPEGYYDYSDEDECWYLLDLADGEAYALEVAE